MAISIALTTANTYAIREVFSPTRALNRNIAINTLTDRVMAALRPYEIQREARNEEQGDRTMPLFPQLSER